MTRFSAVGGVGKARQHFVVQKHEAQAIQGVGETATHGAHMALQHVGSFFLGVFLKDDSCDESFLKIVEMVEAFFDIVDEDDGVLEGGGARTIDAAAEEFAAEQGRNAADFDGHSEEAAEQGAGASAIEPESGIGEMFGGGVGGASHGMLGYTSLKTADWLRPGLQVGDDCGGGFFSGVDGEVIHRSPRDLGMGISASARRQAAQ